MYTRGRGNTQFGCFGPTVRAGATTSAFILFVEGTLSVQAISWVIDKSKHKANPFVVLLMIANHARSDGSGAWPSIHTLAKECRLGDRTVQRAIASLIKTGELRVTPNGGPYGSNLYDIPGVRLTPPGVKLASEGCQTAPILDARAMSPNPSLTVLKDKDGLFYRITPERTRQYLTAEETRNYERTIQ
jgi:hypothetical protein